MLSFYIFIFLFLEKYEKMDWTILVVEKLLTFSSLNYRLNKVTLS